MVIFVVIVNMLVELLLWQYLANKLLGFAWDMCFLTQVWKYTLLR